MKDEEKLLSFDDFHEEIITLIEEGYHDTGDWSKILYLHEILTYLDGLTSIWGEDPDYYYDNRIQASHHSEDWAYLDIVLSEYHGRNDTIDAHYPSKKTLINRFEPVKSAFRAAVKGGYTDIEESNELRGLYKGIYDHLSDIKVIRSILITDYSCDVDSLPDEILDGYTIKYQIWNIEKIYKIRCSQYSPTDNLEIDLMKDFGEKIACMEVNFENHDVEYSSYLGFMKGSLLADLYDKYNERLLEGNIRVFLQTTTSVNKGILSTLSTPTGKSRFFAYNNGISATAEYISVSRPDTNGVRWIEKIHGLQIVNGGQTTASIHTARKKSRSNMEGVYVQMKLTVPRKKDDLKNLNEKIAQYSNTQNQIKKADFTANDPYQIHLQKLSRKEKIPGKDTGWFYERIRGQYGENQRLHDLRQKRGKTSGTLFETLYPKSRRITKTDIALHYNTWNQYPHYASQGGEKNYQKFTSLIANSEGQIVIKPDKRYFHELIAMSILFIRTDAMILEWQKEGSLYGRGYKREILIYTLSLLSYLTEGKLSLEKIWDCQINHGTTKKSINLPKKLEEYIKELIKVGEYHINHPPSYKSDAKEWAKTEASWNMLKREESGIKHIPVPEDVISTLYLTKEEISERANWLASRRIKDNMIAAYLEMGETEGEEDEEVTDEMIVSVDKLEVSLQRDTKPDFRRIVATSKYNEFVKIITKINEDYELSDSDSELLHAITKRKSSNQPIITEHLAASDEIFTRLFNDSIVKNDPDYLRIFGIDPSSYMQVNEMENQGVKTDDSALLPLTGKYFSFRSDNGASGNMVVEGKRFILLKGTTLEGKHDINTTPELVSIHKALIKSGTISIDPKNTSQYCLCQDMPFDNPNIPASFIAGKPIDGFKEWKYNNLPLEKFVLPDAFRAGNGK